jgi:hypothetical protein
VTAAPAPMLTLLKAFPPVALLPVVTVVPEV